MKYKYLILTIIFLGFLKSTFAQTKRYASSSSDNKQNTELEKTTNKNDELKRTHVKVRNLSDGYMGMKQQILAWLVTEVIPEGFPKYVEGQTRDDYQNQVLKWAKNNQKYIKNEYRSRFLNTN